MTANKENLNEFKRTIRDIHKSVTLRPSKDLTTADLEKCERVMRHPSQVRSRKTRQDVIIWRRFRQKVAQLFKRMHNIIGTIDFNIDWAAAYNWLVNNWATIMKILVTIIVTVV